jgi:hypothetical protein
VNQERYGEYCDQDVNGLRSKHGKQSKSGVSFKKGDGRE